MSFSRLEPNLDFCRPRTERAASDVPGRSRQGERDRSAMLFRHEQMGLEADREDVERQTLRRSFDISIPKQSRTEYPRHDDQGRDEEEAALIHMTYFSRSPVASAHRTR